MGKHTRNLHTDEALSPMIISGGVISDGGSGTIDITALTALLRAGTGDTDQLVYVTLAAQTGKTMAAADTKYYVVLTSTPAISIQDTRANGTTEIGLGTCMKDGSDVVRFHNAGMRLQNGIAKLHRRAAALRATELASGCTITDEGGASRQFHIAAGVVYHGISKLTPFSGGAFDSGTDKFTYIHGDTDTGFTYTDDSTVINNTQYWDAAGHALATLTTNKYGCHWVYLHPDDEHVYVVMGTTNNKLAEAQLTPAPTDTPIEISDFAVLLGCIIIEKDATAFATIQMVTDYFFTGTAVADHGALEGLDDDDHIQYILHSLADAENDFLVASEADTFVKKTLAETLAILAHTHALAAGATDVTATYGELNLLDLAALTAGELLVATGAAGAAWQSTGVKLVAPDISGSVSAASALTLPAFTAGGRITLGEHIIGTGIQIATGALANLGLAYTTPGYTALLMLNRADADAEILAVVMNPKGGEGVPVFAIGDATLYTAALGFFNGVTEPRIVVLDGDCDSWVGIGFSADETAAIMFGGATSSLTLPAFTLGGALTASAQNIVTDATTGTEIATAADQKLGFFGATPVIQQAGVAVSAAGIHAALVNLGLITA